MTPRTNDHAHPRPSWTAALALLFAVIAVLGGSCTKPVGRTLDGLLDESSRSRLDAAGAGLVLLSLKGGSPLAALPPLGEGGRLLGRAGTSVLLEVPHEAVSRLAGIEGLVSATVWGDGAATAKLDPGLRAALLEAVDAPSRAGLPLPMIATFREASDDLRDRLVAIGASPRTVAGTVVTLDAAPEAVFRALALPGLVSLSRPRELRMLGQP